MLEWISFAGCFLCLWKLMLSHLKSTCHIILKIFRESRFNNNRLNHKINKLYCWIRVWKKNISHSFVLVITCLEGLFGINCLSAFLEILKLPSKTRAISKFSKITRVSYPKNCPNQTCDCWLITWNQQTLCIETNIF